MHSCPHREYSFVMVLNKRYYDEEDSFAHHFQRPGERIL